MNKNPSIHLPEKVFFCSKSRSPEVLTLFSTTDGVFQIAVISRQPELLPATFRLGVLVIDIPDNPDIFEAFAQLTDLVRADAFCVDKCGTAVGHQHQAVR